MKDQNKPEWLLKAEQEQAKFRETKFGKMTQKEFEEFERNSKGGQTSGNKNIESGHWDKVRKAEAEWTKNNPEKRKEISKKARANSPMGQINKERGWMHQIANFESRSKGGITTGKQNLESGHWAKCQKLATKASVESRKILMYNKRKAITDQLPNGIEFTSKIVKEICNKEGYNSWKALLKDSRFIIKTHHGPNQFNPSMYKRAI